MFNDRASLESKPLSLPISVGQGFSLAYKGVQMFGDIFSANLKVYPTIKNLVGAGPPDADLPMA